MVNIAELLKDCPEGMELDCLMFDNLVLSDVDEGAQDYPIEGRLPNGVRKWFTSDGRYELNKYAKCVIFPKGKTTWEGFVPPCEFKDGDIIYVRTKLFKWVSIYRKDAENDIFTYADSNLDTLKFYGINDDVRALCKNSVICEKRLATVEEREAFFELLDREGYIWDAESKTLTFKAELKIQNFNDGDLLYVNTKQDHEFVFAYRKTNDKDILCKYVSVTISGVLFPNSTALCYFSNIETIRKANNFEEDVFFSTIAKNGYKWDNDTKTLDKLSNVDSKFDFNTLVPFESKVLVRDNKMQKWYAAIWGCYDGDSLDYPYKLIGCMSRYCIPYEGNEHLLGKTDDCDEFYKSNDNDD